MLSAPWRGRRPPDWYHRRGVDYDRPLERSAARAIARGLRAPARPSDRPRGLGQFLTTPGRRSCAVRRWPLRVRGGGAVLSESDIVDKVGGSASPATQGN